MHSLTVGVSTLFPWITVPTAGQGDTQTFISICGSGLPRGKTEEFLVHLQSMDQKSCRQILLEDIERMRKHMERLDLLLGVMRYGDTEHSQEVADIVASVREDLKVIRFKAIHI